MSERVHVQRVLIIRVLYDNNNKILRNLHILYYKNNYNNYNSLNHFIANLFFFNYFLCKIIFKTR